MNKYKRIKKILLYKIAILKRSWSKQKKLISYFKEVKEELVIIDRH